MWTCSFHPPSIRTAGRTCTQRRRGSLDRDDPRRRCVPAGNGPRRGPPPPAHRRPVRAVPVRTRRRLCRRGAIRRRRKHRPVDRRLDVERQPRTTGPHDSSTADWDYARGHDVQSTRHDARANGATGHDTGTHRSARYHACANRSARHHTFAHGPARHHTFAQGPARHDTRSDRSTGRQRIRSTSTDETQEQTNRHHRDVRPTLTSVTPVLSTTPVLGPPALQRPSAGRGDWSELAGSCRDRRHHGGGGTTSPGPLRSSRRSHHGYLVARRLR